jgi:ATP-dependent helicase/nuclease subunit B
MSFFNIPATLDFSKILAQECERLAHQTGISLPQFKIYLPTRRAIRTLQEAFLTLSDGKPRLLPLMQPIGDADIEESYFTDGFEFDILPPIDGLRRQLVLARLLEKSWPYEYNYQQALSIASDLGVLIDQIHTENLNNNHPNTQVIDNIILKM